MPHAGVCLCLKCDAESGSRACGFARGWYGARKATMLEANREELRKEEDEHGCRLKYTRAVAGW